MEPITEVAGDVVCIQFGQEEEVALFIPGSSDVLLCSTAAWRGLVNFDADDCNREIVENSSVELKATLDKLGATLV